MPDKRIHAKKIAVCAVLAVFAAVTGILEGMLPLNFVLPVPGVRLGLANVFVMGAYLLYGAGYAAAVSLARMTLIFLFTGNATALFLSFSGGCFAFAGLCLMMRFYEKNCTMIGVSSVSSALHGAGQLAAAYWVVGAPVIWYLPPLCALSALTGIFTGTLMNRIAARLSAHLHYPSAKRERNITR